jgi:hypothetical protein
MMPSFIPCLDVGLTIHVICINFLEFFKPSSAENANVGDETSKRTSGVGSSGETEYEYLITFEIITGDIAIRLANVVVQATSNGSCINSIVRIIMEYRDRDKMDISVSIAVCKIVCALRGRRRANLFAKSNNWK